MFALVVWSITVLEIKTDKTGRRVVAIKGRTTKKELKAQFQKLKDLFGGKDE